MAEISARREPGGMIEASTFAEGFHRAVEMFGDRTALRTVDGEVCIDWETLGSRVGALAGGLAKLGLGRGQTVALMLNNRPEFHLFDLAAVLLGAVPFSIYQTLAPEQIEYVVADAGATIAVVEQPFLASFLEAKKNLPRLQHVIVVGDDVPSGMLSVDEVENTATPFDCGAASRAVKPDDLLTLIYTSGTTGPPKGVQITHRNLMAVVRGMNAIMSLPSGGRVVSWLPTAHIAERALNYYLPMLTGATITTCANPREILSVLPKVRPQFFFAVPRIWEKLKAGLEAQLASLPEAERVKVQAALATALEKVHLEQEAEEVPAELAAQVAQLDRDLFAPIRVMLGLDAAEVVTVGAAPTPREVLEFFHAIGVPLGEGWGMSETCAVGTINPPGRVKLGTVGIPIPGIEIKIAADGEILIRGDNIMTGYRNQPEKTAETILPDGWLATGDIGEFDADGYLRIVDRKKELIINAAGKNMSPANIESTLKAASPLIGQVCVFGDARPYNTALIVLDADFAPSWAGTQGRQGKSLEDLARDEKIIDAVRGGVDAANAKLSRVEQIKKFRILPGDWIPGGDELTPTMKLKRKPIGQKYADVIEGMYAEKHGSGPRSGSARPG